MTQSTTIRVMIVDDHSMMRTGLRYTLESFDDILLVAEAESPCAQGVLQPQGGLNGWKCILYCSQRSEKPSDPH